MNATSITRPDLIERENAGDSDSDTNSDEIPEYYQPISSIDGDSDGDHDSNLNGYHQTVDPHINISNGHDHLAAIAENGVRSLNVSEDEEERESEEEEEERRRAELEARRAFEEDESRRNAPLTEENAVRVMNAMRGVSFAGFAPDWVSDVPEDRWADQLRRLRHPPHSAA